MKSTKRQPKPNDPSSKPKQTPASNQSEGQSLNVTDEPIELTEDVPEAIKITLSSDRSADDDSSQPLKAQRTSKPRIENAESSEHFQHIKFLDWDKPVGRVMFECWHCEQEIISEFTSEPVMGEYKGRPSVTQVKIQCPNL